MKKFKDFISEDGEGGSAPTNCTGANIAGTGATDSTGKVTNQGMPGVSKKKNPILGYLKRKGYNG